MQKIYQKEKVLERLRGLTCADTYLHIHSTPFSKSMAHVYINPLPDNKFLDSFKLKEFADDNFRFDENGIKLSKWVENTVRKGEIARNVQFLLFPQCFQKACFPGSWKGVIVWEWVNWYILTNNLSQHST